jgi:hypothetical protein
MGDQDRAIASGRRAFEIADDVGDAALRDMARRYLGCAYYAVGDYKAAIDAASRRAFSVGSSLTLASALSRLASR